MSLFPWLPWSLGCFVWCFASDVDVIVIGGGPSGLSTVQHLQSAKVSVALLEKASRLGGRIWTLKYPVDGGEVGVDVGPAWIHYGTANPLTYLAQQGNCTLIRTRNLNMDVYHQGKAVPRAVILEMFDLLDLIEREYEQYKDRNSADASLLLVLQQLFHEKKFKLSAEQQAAFAAILFGEVVEDWTAPLDELSAAKHCAYDNVDGVGSDWRVVEGMECVLKSMYWNFSHPKVDAKSPLLQLNHTAKSIQLDGGQVVVEGDQGGNPWMLSAKAVIVAVPLGELKEGHLKIDGLPRWKAKALQELGLGHAIRAALEFEHHPWSTDVEFFMDIADCMSETLPGNHSGSQHQSENQPGDDDFLQNIDLCSIEFTSSVSQSVPVLVAEADGRLAQKLSNFSDDEILDFLLSRLRLMFGDLKLKQGFISRPWGLPFWHKNSQGRKSAWLAGKAIDRIFFAGDYVSHNVGTVASAYLSGIAAAHAVLCYLGHPGLDLESHPAILPMIQRKCAQREVMRKGDRCKLSLWEILYKCSALPDLEDESGRSCFVQGHDQWTDADKGSSPMGWWQWLWSWSSKTTREEM